MMYVVDDNLEDIVPINVLKHTKCGCECVNTANNCTKDNRTCPCICKYVSPPKPCPTGLLWSSHDCACMCQRPPEVCTVEKTWDSRQCRCSCNRDAVSRCNLLGLNITDKCQCSEGPKSSEKPKAPATITQPLRNKQKVSLGYPLEITCIASGNPVPTVVWTRTGQTDNLFSGRGKAILQFNKVLEENLGNYTCNATNYKSDLLHYFIDADAPATITEPLRNKQKVSLGYPLEITCIASGNPVPTVVWTRTGQTDNLFSGRGKATLQFNEVLEENLGNYTCNATNYKSDLLHYCIDADGTSMKQSLPLM
ncbi:Hemicentin-1 [Exaiptasia diaphana]|nr:Hemicentin-1 [Exaiptasia diaphana]